MKVDVTFINSIPAAGTVRPLRNMPKIDAVRPELSVGTDKIRQAS